MEYFQPLIKMRLDNVYYCRKRLVTHSIGCMYREVTVCVRDVKKEGHQRCTRPGTHSSQDRDAAWVSRHRWTGTKTWSMHTVQCQHAICGRVDRPRDSQAEWRKAERWASCDVADTWNPKCDTNGLVYKTNSQTQKNVIAKRDGKGWTGVWG